MAGIQAMPEGVGVARLAAALSPEAGFAFTAVTQRGTGRPRASLRGKGREAGEHGKRVESRKQRAGVLPAKRRKNTEEERRAGKSKIHFTIQASLAKGLFLAKLRIRPGFSLECNVEVQ